MYFQPAHLPFGPQKDAFYGGRIDNNDDSNVHTYANSWTMYSGNHKSANCSKKIYVNKIFVSIW